MHCDFIGTFFVVLGLFPVVVFLVYSSASGVSGVLGKTEHFIIVARLTASLATLHHHHRLHFVLELELERMKEVIQGIK